MPFAAPGLCTAAQPVSPRLSLTARVTRASALSESGSANPVRDFAERDVLCLYWALTKLFQWQ